MKLSDYKGEQALDILADLIEPAAAIMADKEIANFAKSGKPVITLVKPLIKGHKKEVIEIMAVLEGETPEKYKEKVNIFTLPAKLLEILNDEELMSLFTSQGQKTDETTSGSAMESTEDNVQ